MCRFSTGAIGFSFDRNLDLVGKTATLLVDQLLDDDVDFAAVGRTEGQALDVDGVTQIVAPADVQPGDMVEVRITDADDYDLVAELVLENPLEGAN